VFYFPCTGLGLWVTSEILKKNGWTIRVRSSRAAGRSGTVFAIAMPKLDGVSGQPAPQLPSR
jgi:signal transduction histidine kinase